MTIRIYLRLSFLFLNSLLLFMLIVSMPSFAQEVISPPQVYHSIYNDTSPPLREMKEAPLFPSPWKSGVIPLLKNKTKVKEHYRKDNSLQSHMGTTGTSTIIQSWDGVSAGLSIPPDNSGDVGPNHYMEMVNTQFEIWDKTGVSLLGPLSLSTLWSGFPGPWSTSLNDGDPVILYDEAADRWVATQFSLPNFSSTPNYILVAVSQTGDPTGSWYRYGFEFPDFPDYPKYGVWPDGYYVSANHFSGGVEGTTNAVFQRDMMLNGEPAQMVLFNTSISISWSLLPSDWNGANTPPAGSPNYFGQIHDNAVYGGSDGFDIFQFHVDWTIPTNSTFTGPTFINTNSFSQVNGIPQQGTSQLLDDLSDRVMNRLDYRNFGSHQSMVACHTVDAGSGRAGMRWYEFRNYGSGWSLYQQGTYAPDDGLYRWMGSIAINTYGAIALGYSVSGSSIYPEIRYTGRQPGDTPGIMTLPEETIYAGSGSQTNYPRWGDYTQMVVDPDGVNFWYVNQYQPYDGNFNWQTRIASFTFGPPCPVDPPINPNPGDGSTNVPVSLSQLSWQNGAGATQCEVWFGEPGAVDMVYDGSLISSWPITSPLDYNTEYLWHIVDKNDTCDATGSTWSFTTELSPNIVFTESFEDMSFWTPIGPYGAANWSISNTSNAGGINPELDLNWDPQFDGLSKLVSDNIPIIGNHKYSVSFNHMIDWFSNTAPTLGLGISYNNGSTYTPIWSVQPTGNVGPDQVTATFTTSSGTTNLNLILFCNGNSYNIDDWFIDNITMYDDEFAFIDDPTNISAESISSSQIDLSFTPNSNDDNVVIVWNLSGIFDIPSGSPPVPGQPFAGGTLLSNGTISPVHHTGLDPLTTYYYKLFSYNETFYSPGVTVNAQTMPPVDFAVDFLVSDNCENLQILTFGTAPGATDCFDEGLDQIAPPPPPPGGFDSRFIICDDNFFKDFRNTNSDGERIWHLQYEPVDGCSPINFSWDPGQLPAEGYFHLIDPLNGSLVNINMRLTDHYTDILNLGVLEIKYNYEIESSFNINSGWNMLSLPVNVADSYYLNLFPNALEGTLYGYSTGYYSTETITPNSGYWLKFPAAEIVNVLGQDRTESVISLIEGWNMIGGPNCNVPLSNINDPDTLIIPGTIYGYSEGYFNAGSIDATKGFWLKAKAPGSILISCGFIPSGPIRILTTPAEAIVDFGKIDITDSDGKSQTLYFNGKLNKDISIESFSLPPVPPAGIFDARLEGGYKLSESDNVTIRIQSRQYPINVTITNSGNKLGSNNFLQEISDGKVTGSHRIVNGENIIISNPKTTILKIAKADILPTTYCLEQNFPNPFNPTTTIKFSLPEAANVTLTIYNTLGQKLAELVNSKLEAGNYSYEWDAGNVATGMYIYELRTDKFVSIKKMMLVK